MVGGSRQSSGIGKSRRAELVNAAFRLVAESGLEGLRLRQVAEAVGIDHSTLHHYFATKQDLVGAVTEFTTRQFWSTMPSATDPAAQLRGHLDTLRSLMTDRPALFLVTAELDLRAGRDPAVQALLHGFENGWRKSLRELVDRGTAAGAWSSGVETDAVVELIIATVKGSRLNPGGATAAFDQLHRLITSEGRP